MIFEYLAAAGGAYEEFALTPALRDDGGGASVGEQPVPSTYRGYPLRDIGTTAEGASLVTVLVLQSSVPKNIFSRIEFMIGSSLDRVFYIDQFTSAGTTTLEGPGTQWTAPAGGYVLTPGVNYTVRLFY